MYLIIDKSNEQYDSDLIRLIFGVSGTNRGQLTCIPLLFIQIQTICQKSTDLIKAGGKIHIKMENLPDFLASPIHKRIGYLFESKIFEDPIDDTLVLIRHQMMLYQVDADPHNAGEQRL